LWIQNRPHFSKRWAKIYQLFQKSGRKPSTRASKSYQNPSSSEKLGRESTTCAVGVVENRTLIGFLLQKSKKLVEIEAAF
jgi:hypothetical protein